MTRILLAAVLAATLQPDATWVDGDVAYIVTDSERELFVSLETDEERAYFITAFWTKRDPNPITPENEFRDEHHRRVDYANQFLGRESFVPGWRTDRGRYYIILGEPRTIQRFYGHNTLKEAELWFFQGHEGRGLPAFFYLLFFKRDEVGDYQLYHPLADGPASLLRGGVRDDVAAIETLQAIDPELAHASLSLDAGEPPDLIGGRAAIGADGLLARINDSPHHAIETDYVEAWKRYNERVDAEYAFNYVPNRHVFSVMAGPDETPIVHFSIELDPESFGLETDEAREKFVTTLDVTVEARQDGTLVHSTARSTPVELTGSNVDRVQTSPIAYQDDFPLVPGRYTVSVLMKNRALKNYTLAESRLDIPVLDSAAPAIVDVILCHDSSISTESVAPDEVRTFQLGASRLEPAAGRVFAVGDVVTVFTQVLRAPEGATIQFDLLSGTDVVDRDTGSTLGELATLGLDGGEYEVRVRVLDPGGVVHAEKRAALTLSPRTELPRPAFVYRRAFNTKTPGLLPLVRADQLWRLERYERAQRELEAAVAADNPRLPQARWKLATAYLRAGDVDEALALLTPLGETFPHQFEVVAGLGLGHYLKHDYESTIRYLERAAAIRAPDTRMLNALGDSHQRLGHADEAKRYFERSLALDPDQADVQKRLRHE